MTPVGSPRKAHRSVSCTAISGLPCEGAQGKHAELTGARKEEPRKWQPRKQRRPRRRPPSVRRRRSRPARARLPRRPERRPASKPHRCLLKNTDEKGRSALETGRIGLLFL